MALSMVPHEGSLLGIFLVLVSLLLSPVTPAAIEPPLRVSSLEEPQSPRRIPQLFSDFLPRHYERDGSCAVSGEGWCGHDLPGDFCCPSESSCKVLAANTTILCCPEGKDCTVIQPITCEIGSQDSSKYPGAPIKTLALDKNLKRCGIARCCPFGYSCKGGSQCVLDKDQEESYAFLLPESTSTTSTISPTSTSSTSTTDVLSVETSVVPDEVIPGAPPSTSATTTESSSPDDDDEDQGETQGGVGPTGVVTAGTVAGVCCLAGVSIFVWMKWFRRRRTSPDTPHMPLTRESWGYFSSTGEAPTTRYLRITRGPDDKFVVTPSTAGFSPPPPPPITEPKPQSPVELPATPVSLCMWMNLENAAVEEPKLAYVVPPKPQTRQ
ncbi:hypothetical protein FALBO_2988 [Fusarium albosuccineum]|uniref:Uncharacterized protein n=1 Tax=Fusarium albosuccineum TaxID=1237068 RepID=A0A8H4LM33_9HYPO|nr:hypothetical protein FALBO_2988 [Fusarium albosuccineum]